MARGDESRRASATSVDEAKLLYQSLDQYNQDQDDKRRPSIILTALIILFLSAAGGIALAIVLMVEFEDIGAASLPRDVILFAAILSLLYIVLHLRGAKRSYKRDSMGPPQLRGHYLHASALLVARLGIACWTIALTVTVVMIARDLPDEGFLAKVPWLDLVICIGAIPSCIIISVTIERNRTPFATTAISSPAFLSCRVSEYADDEDRITDLSVSRRPSFNRQKRDSPSEKTVVTLPSAAIFQLGDMARYEKVLAKAKRKSNNKKHKSAPAAVENLPSMDEKEESLLPVFKTGGPLSSNPPSPRMSMDQTQAHADPAVPEPTYCPGGWRTEWNNVAHEVGVQSLPESVADDASSIWPSPYRPQETPAETPTRSSTPMTTISQLVAATAAPPFPSASPSLSLFPLPPPQAQTTEPSPSLQIAEPSPQRQRLPQPNKANNDIPTGDIPTPATTNTSTNSTITPPTRPQTPRRHSSSHQHQHQHQHRQEKRQRPITACTSIASSAARSNLSTVRYAAEPEIAVRQEIRVVPNPAYRGSRRSEGDRPLALTPGAGSGVKSGNGGSRRPDPAVLLVRKAQRAKQRESVDGGTGGDEGVEGVGVNGGECGVGAKGVNGEGAVTRKPSNFSRPIQTPSLGGT